MVKADSPRPPPRPSPHRQPQNTQGLGLAACTPHPRTGPSHPPPPPPGLGAFIRRGGQKVIPTSRAFEGPGELWAHAHPEEGSRQVPAVLANSPTERITVYF